MANHPEFRILSGAGTVGDVAAWSITEGVASNSLSDGAASAGAASVSTRSDSVSRERVVRTNLVPNPNFQFESQLNPWLGLGAELVREDVGDENYQGSLYRSSGGNGTVQLVLTVVPGQRYYVGLDYSYSNETATPPTAPAGWSGIKVVSGANEFSESVPLLTNTSVGHSILGEITADDETLVFYIAALEGVYEGRVGIRNVLVTEATSTSSYPGGLQGVYFDGDGVYEGTASSAYRYRWSGNELPISYEYERISTPTEFLVANDVRLSIPKLGYVEGSVQSVELDGNTSATMTLATTLSKLNTDRVAQPVGGPDLLLPSGGHDWRDVGTDVGVELWFGGANSRTGSVAVVYDSQTATQSLRVQRRNKNGSTVLSTSIPITSGNNLISAVGNPVTDELYVATYHYGTNVSSLLKFSATNVLLATWSNNYATGPLKFNDASSSGILAMTPDGASLYVANSTSITRINTSTGAVIQTAAGTHDSIAIGGAYLFAVNSSSYTASITRFSLTTLVSNLTFNVEMGVQGIAADAHGLIVTGTIPPGAEAQIARYRHDGQLGSSTVYRISTVGEPLTRLTGMYSQNGETFTHFYDPFARASRMGRWISYGATLYGAFRYYFALAGINRVDWYASVDPVILARSWSGNLWNYLNELCSIYMVEIAVINGTLEVRDMAARVQNVENITPIRSTASIEGSARVFQIVNYNASVASDIVLYRSLEHLTVNSGEFSYFNIATDHQPTRINPFVQVSALSLSGVESEYVMRDSTGAVLIPGSWPWALRPSVTYSEEGFRVVVQGYPDASTLRYESSAYTGPYTIELLIRGSGLACVPVETDIYTGASSSVNRSSGPSLDSPFLTTVTLTNDAASWAARLLGAPQQEVTFAIGIQQIESLGVTAGSIFSLRDTLYRINRVTFGPTGATIVANPHVTVADLEGAWSGFTDAGQVSAHWESFEARDLNIRPLR